MQSICRGIYIADPGSFIPGIGIATFPSGIGPPVLSRLGIGICDNETADGGGGIGMGIETSTGDRGIGTAC